MKGYKGHEYVQELYEYIKEDNSTSLELSPLMKINSDAKYWENILVSNNIEIKVVTEVSWDDWCEQMNIYIGKKLLVKAVCDDNFTYDMMAFKFCLINPDYYGSFWFPEKALDLSPLYNIQERVIL